MLSSIDGELRLDLLRMEKSLSQVLRDLAFVDLEVVWKGCPVAYSEVSLVCFLLRFALQQALGDQS